MRDGRVDVLGDGGGIKITVTIDTDRHGKFRRGAGCPFQRAALLGAYRSKQGNALHPPSESPRDTLQTVGMKVL